MVISPRAGWLAMITLRIYCYDMGEACVVVPHIGLLLVDLGVQSEWTEEKVLSSGVGFKQLNEEIVVVVVVEGIKWMLLLLHGTPIGCNTRRKK